MRQRGSSPQRLTDGEVETLAQPPIFHVGGEGIRDSDAPRPRLTPELSEPPRESNGIVADLVRLVRRDEHPRVLPERARPRERLHLKHVEPSRCQRPIQRRHQCSLLQDGSPA